MCLTQDCSLEVTLHFLIRLYCVVCAGRGFREEREYHGTKDHPTLSRFYFLTRCWSGHLKQFLLKVKKEDRAPDLIVVLSCLWDINRSDESFKSNFVLISSLHLDTAQMGLRSIKRTALDSSDSSMRLSSVT